MKFIHYINGEAYVEGLSLNSIAEEYGTPCYVYSRQVIEENYHAFINVLQNNHETEKQHLICYAVKANSNLSILNLLARLGSGFDIVSGGELERVLAAGGDPQKIVFSGVGKQVNEIKRALEANIFCFNVESEAELERIQELAKQQQKIASITLRVNPNIDGGTHPYISTGLKNNKFGIDPQTLTSLLPKIKHLPNIKIIGLACHIGSQLLSMDPFLEVMKFLRQLYLEFTEAGIPLQYLNMGGGLGVRYHNENPPTRSDYVSTIKKMFDAYPVNIILEPGRSIIADAGILLTRVEYVKKTPEKNFAITDAAMNDFMRPALYNAWQDIIPVTSHTELQPRLYDIVGPVCESADFLGQNRRLRLKAGDILAVLMAGAYGFSMGSNYNSRLRPAEILVDDDQSKIIRRRETLQDMFALEKASIREIEYEKLK